MNEILKKILNPYFNTPVSEDENQFFTYFNATCQINTIFADDPFISIEIFTNANDIKIDQIIITSKLSIVNPECFKISDILPLIIRHYNKDNKDNFNNLCEDFSLQIEDINKHVNSKQLKNNIDSIIDCINKDEDACLQTKIHLELNITNEHGYYLPTFYIGRNKLYKIKDIQSFKNKIINKQFYSYGRDLSFSHNIEYFDDLAKHIITYLMYKNIEEFGLTCNDIPSLLKFYQGKTIKIDNEEYEVSNTPLDIQIHINKDYSLSIQGIPNNSKRIFSYYYLINNVIYPASLNPVISNLVSVIQDNPLGIIKDNFELYKTNFFDKYKNYFTYDVNLEDQIKRDTFTYKTYFDYTKKGLTAEIKIFHYQEQISVNQISDFSSQHHKFSNYSQILQNLGFENGIITAESRIWDFLTCNLDLLKQYSEIYLSDNLLNRKVRQFNTPSIKLTYNAGSSMIDAIMSETEYSEEELIAIYNAIKENHKFVKLNSSFIDLTSNETKSFVEAVDGFKLISNGKVSNQKQLPLYSAFSNISLNDSCISMDEYIESIFYQIKNYAKSNIDIPSINGELRNYQIDGVKWLCVLYKNYLGGILADDMGLGKTIETITFLKTVQPLKPVLIVCPKSLVFNWRSEFSKFDEATKVLPILGSSETRKEIIESISKNKYAIYLISYETLRNDIELFADKEFDTCILDEAQFIKNAFAKKTNAVKLINAKHKFALTGTPIENNVLDLWSIFDFIMPDYFISINDFKSKFENDENYSKVIRAKSMPFILRRNKKDVLKDLPAKYEVLYSVEMGDEQRKAYDSIRINLKKSVESDNSAIDILAAITKLREICVDPNLCFDGYKGTVAKHQALKELLIDKINEGHRVLIFSQFVSALNNIIPLLKLYNLSYKMITGDTASKERLNICNTFNNNENIKVVLISLKAGGTGLNLTGADTVIHLDPWWNLAAENQASDRAHRIGQTRTVEVIKLICENSIEEQVITLQNKKKNLVNQLVEDSPDGIQKMSIKELKELLSI